MAKREKVPGIFIHTHRKSGSFYVGTSADVYRGVVEDQRRLLKGEHFNTELQRLYDEDSLIDSVVEVCESLPAAKARRTEIAAEGFSNPLMLNKSGGLNVTAVYRLLHKPSGHFYIGSTADFTNRRKHHEYTLTRGEHGVEKLQSLFSTEPDLSTLEWTVSLMAGRELAYITEQRMLDLEESNPLLLNVAKGVHGNTGCTMTHELREQMGKRSKEKWQDLEYRQHMREVRSKPVSIMSVLYPCAKDAAATLNIVPPTLYSRLTSKSETWKDWRYV